MATAHIIYAALFRISIIAAGFGCVVLGYRLFVHGVMPKIGSEIDAQAGEIRLTLKNAAPGTCFAALGVLMIVAMVIQGNPEKKIVEVITKEGTRRETTYRSNDKNILAAINSGKKLEQAGRLDEATKAYAAPLNDGNLPLKDAADPLKAIAAVYLRQDRYDEAIAYASLAFQVDQANSNVLALIARIQFRRGKYEEAIEAISEAARNNPTFIAERDRMKGQRP